MLLELLTQEDLEAYIDTFMDVLYYRFYLANGNSFSVADVVAVTCGFGVIFFALQRLFLFYFNDRR